MRRALVLVMLAAGALAGPAAGAGTPQVRFPRDHFAHAAGIEWWYFTALAKDAAGTPYTVFFTLFAAQGGLVPVSQVVNLRTGKVVGHSEEVAFGAAGTSALDVTAGHARLRFARAANTWRFAVSTPGYAVSLEQRPTKPYALHGGGTGVIRQSVAGVSHYYSSTRMRAAGRLRAGGRTVAITGESWLDHQWGSFRDDPRAYNWDWFSCRYDDGSELMLYQFRDRVTGKPLARFRNGTFVSRGGRTAGVTSFTAVHGSRALVAAGRRWPLDWRLAVPALGLRETVRAIVPDQLVRNSVVPTFWEGASTATGTRAGTCFVELSYR